MCNAVKPKWYTVFAISSTCIGWGSWSKCAPVALVLHPVMRFGGGGGGDDDDDDDYDDYVLLGL